MARFDIDKRDSTYSWIVLIAIIVSNLCAMGFIYGALGICSTIFPTVFNKPQLETNIIASVVISVNQFSAPVNTMVMRVVGCQAISGVGALFTLAGILSSAFATEIWHCVLSLGILASLGMSLIMTSTLGTIPQHFDKRQGLAYAGIGLGSSLGLIVWPYMISGMFETYGYKLTMLYITPIFLLTVGGPIVFRQHSSDHGKPESVAELAKSYAKALPHFITPFYMLDTLLNTGARGALIIVLFDHLVKVSDKDVAAFSYTILGISFVAGTTILTLANIKFNVNCFVLMIVTGAAFGAGCLALASMTTTMYIYVCLVVIGFTFGLTFGVKGGLAAHLYPVQHIAFICGITEAIGGCGALLTLLAMERVQVAYGSVSVMYCVGGMSVLASLCLIIPALIRPAFWSRYENSHHHRHPTLDVLMHTFGILFLPGTILFAPAPSKDLDIKPASTEGRNDGACINVALTTDEPIVL